MQTKTHEQFVADVFSIVKNEYTILSKYTGVNNKITIKHNKCEYVFETTPHSFLYRHRCPKCTRERVLANARKPHTLFVKEVASLVGDEYTVLGIYINNLTKISMRHNKCGHVYAAIPLSFLQGNRCPACKNKRIGDQLRKTHEEFMSQITNLVGDSYDILDKYTNSNTKIPVRHKECGTVYQVYPDLFLRGLSLRGRYCPKCSRIKKKTHNEFLEDVFRQVENEYTVLNEYRNDRTKITIKHNKCGNVYDVKPNSFLQGARCPQCSQSRGEERIARYLRHNSIKFTREYRIKSCRDKNPLPFDFAIFNNNGELNCLIEYDGAQHFKPIARFGGETRHKDRIRKDRIKDSYCKNNNIPLIRMSYTENNIEKRLEQELTKLGIMPQGRMAG